MLDDFQKPRERRPVRFDTMHDDRPTFGRPSLETPPSQRPAGEHEPRQLVNDEPAFRPPEEVADEDIRKQESLPTPPNPHPEAKAHMPAKKPWWKPRKPAWSRKQWILAGIVAALVIFAGTVGIVLAMSHKKTSPPPPPKPVTKTAPAPKPAAILSPLTGSPVTQQQHDLSVIGVMIENSQDARPQSGLDQAGVVFEAIAEAGITRFLALYQEGNPAVLGPVRSARPYYINWLLGFDASYAHVGGSPDALQLIKAAGVKDMDQFYNSSAYHRISTRYAPHNMYTSLAALRDLANSKGYTKSTFTPFARKAKEDPSKSPTARSIDFALSGSYYNVHYDYDPTTNSYKRSEGGSPHIDNETKAQLSPKVVIALAMPYSLMADGYHSQYQTIGSGSMLLFQDGTVTPGTWSKVSPTDQFVFKDGQGKDMQLDPGQTWITVLGSISDATYRP